MPHQCRVVVCEDDPATRTMLLEAFAFEGYEAQGCADADTAQQLVRDVRPHLLILDGMFATGDGIRLLRRVREDAAAEDLRVLVLSAASDRLHAHQAELKALRAAALPKPFDVDELLMLVRELVAPARLCIDLSEPAAPPECG